MLGQPLGFNPLAGIRCFLTEAISVSQSRFERDCFNPLAGIRCFLTENNRRWTQPVHQRFQSPSGDSLFSDTARQGSISKKER